MKFSAPSTTQWLRIPTKRRKVGGGAKDHRGVLLFFLTEHAEADSFWCFTNLMAEIRDNFIKHLDESECGIGQCWKILLSEII